MKKLLLAIILTAALLALPTGCATANKAAYKTTEVASVTGDIGLRVWADYVSARKAQGNPVPLSQEIEAKRAWNAYEDARDVVFTAGIAYSRVKEAGGDVTGAQLELNAAMSALAASQTQFIALLQSFGVKFQ